MNSRLTHVHNFFYNKTNECDIKLRSIVTVMARVNKFDPDILQQNKFFILIIKILQDLTLDFKFT